MVSCVPHGCRIGLPNCAVGGPWQEQWILPRIVPAGTDRPRLLHQDRTACVCHIVEHRLAFGLFEHSLGSSGCSRKHHAPIFHLDDVGQYHQSKEGQAVIVRVLLLMGLQCR